MNCLSKLEQLGKLWDVNLKFNPTKCLLFRHQVNYLQHAITRDGIQTDPANIRAVREDTKMSAFFYISALITADLLRTSDIAKPLHWLTEQK